MIIITMIPLILMIIVSSKVWIAEESNKSDNNDNDSNNDSNNDNDNDSNNDSNDDDNDNTCDVAFSEESQPLHGLSL